MKANRDVPYWNLTNYEILLTNEFFEKKILNIFDSCHFYYFKVCVWQMPNKTLLFLKLRLQLSKVSICQNWQLSKVTFDSFLAFCIKEFGKTLKTVVL